MKLIKCNNPGIHYFNRSINIKQLICVAFFAFISYDKQAQVYQSALSFGDALDDVTNGVVITADGYILSVGGYQGGVNVGQCSVMSSNLSVDAFIGISDVQGNCLAMISYGTVNTDYAEGVHLLDNGNIIVYGVWNSTNNCVNCGKFVSCFDTNLNLLWTRSIFVGGGDLSVSVVGNSVGLSGTVAGGGTSLLLGNTWLQLPNSSSGFVAVLDEDGDTKWATAIGNEYGTALGPRASYFDVNDVFIISGTFQNSVVIGSESLTASNGLLDTDGYVAMVNEMGIEWVDQTDRPYSVRGVMVKSIEDEYIVGHRINTDVEFDSLEYRFYTSEGAVSSLLKVRYDYDCVICGVNGRYNLVSLGNGFFLMGIKVYSEWENFAPLWIINADMEMVCALYTGDLLGSDFKCYDWDQNRSWLAIAGRHQNGINLGEVLIPPTSGGRDAFVAVRNYYSEVSLSLPLDTVYVNDQNISLVNEDMPAYSGNFTGPGIVDGYFFSPVDAGPGTHLISWQFGDGSCNYQGTDSIVVLLSTNFPHEVKDNVVVYPNPSGGELWILGLDSESVFVRLFDIAGIERKAWFTDGFVNLEDLPMGMYVMHVYDGDKVLYVKLLIE